MKCCFNKCWVGVVKNGFGQGLIQKKKADIDDEKGIQISVVESGFNI